MVICHEGLTSHGRIPITNHVLDIPKRLKEILPAAFIMFNTITGQFEIHDASQRSGTLACTLPFDTLDARTLSYALQYRRERLEETLRDIERHNERLERKAERAHLDRAGTRMREALTYLNAHPHCDTLPKELIAA